MPTLEEVRSIDYPEIVDLGEFDPIPDEETATDGEQAEPGSDAEQPAAEDAGQSTELAPQAGETPEAQADDAGTETSEREAGFDKAAAYDKLNEEWQADPVRFMQRFSEGLTAEQKVAIGIATAQSAAAPDFEPESPAEEWLAAQAPIIKALPQFAQTVSQQFTMRDQYLNEALVGTAALEAKLDAVLQIVGLELPALDAKAVSLALADGKSGYADAIKKVYRPALDRAVAAKKQAGKPRPKTPGDSAGDLPQVKPGQGMAEIFNKF